MKYYTRQNVSGIEADQQEDLYVWGNPCGKGACWDSDRNPFRTFKVMSNAPCWVGGGRLRVKVLGLAVGSHDAANASCQQSCCHAVDKRDFPDTFEGYPHI